MRIMSDIEYFCFFEIIKVDLFNVYLHEKLQEKKRYNFST